MRILHIDTGSQMRGGQHQVMMLLRLLSEAGHEVVLLARRDGPLYRTAQSSGITTERAELLSTYRMSGQVDIVHAHDARAHTLCAVAARKPFVVSRRVSFPVRQGMLSRWKYARAARYLAVSNFVARQLESYGIDASRIDTIYDAVANASTGVWDPSAPAIALDSSDPGKCRGLVAEAASKAGIPVVFSCDLPRDLRRASMFVYLTRSEGLGSAAILALAMGIPVVASRVEGLAEVFEEGVSGLYTWNDSDTAAAAMRNVIDTPGLGKRLSEEGKRRAEAEFSASRMLGRTVMAYEKALSA